MYAPFLQSKMQTGGPRVPGVNLFVGATNARICATACNGVQDASKPVTAPRNARGSTGRVATRMSALQLHQEGPGCEQKGAWLEGRR